MLFKTLTFLSFSIGACVSQATVLECQTSLSDQHRTGIYEVTVFGDTVAKELKATKIVVNSYTQSKGEKIAPINLLVTTDAQTKSTIENCDGDCTATTYTAQGSDFSLLVLTEANTDKTYTAYLTLESKKIYHQLVICTAD